MKTDAIQHGMPGEWARVRGTVLSLWPLFLACGLVGAFVAAMALGRHEGVFAMLLGGSLVYMVWACRKGLRRVESFFKGARGEERVGALLAGLPAGYHVFHDLPARAFHVDHVVVGPAGVFAVETKNWRGQVKVVEEHVLVDGQLPSRSPVRQAVAEAGAVAARLKEAGWSGTVTPLVCFASDTFGGETDRAEGCDLLNAVDIVGWILARPAVLSPEEVARLVALLETRP